MDLTEAREKIDEIDSELIKLLSERIKLIKNVAKYKQKNNIPIVQEKRMEDMSRKRRALAEELSLDPCFIERLFLEIVDESIKIQKKISNRC